MRINQANNQTSFKSRYHNFFRKVAKPEIKPKEIKKPYIPHVKNEADVFDKDCIEKLEMPQRLEIPREEIFLKSPIDVQEIMEALDATRVKTNGIILIRRRRI